MKTLDKINRLIAATETELAELASRRSKLLGQIAGLKRDKAALLQPSIPSDLNGRPTLTNQSYQDEKITLFRRREDLYPRVIDQKN